MPSTTDAVLQLALALPPESRAALAEKLLESLDSSNDAEIKAAWAEEAENRIEAYGRDELKAIPAEQVFQASSRKKQS
jgi:putative addiction module component (TIGR02574 family)